MRALLRRLAEPVLRLLLALALAGVAITELDLARGFFGTDNRLERLLVVAVSVVLVVLAAPLIRAARPPRR